MRKFSVNRQFLQIFGLFARKSPETVQLRINLLTRKLGGKSCLYAVKENVFSDLFFCSHLNHFFCINYVIRMEDVLLLDDKKIDFHENDCCKPAILKGFITFL